MSAKRKAAVRVAATPPSLQLEYPDAPFVEEFIHRYGTSCVALTKWALYCYQQRGTPAIPHWKDFCYVPVNAAVSYCLEEWGMGISEASVKGRYFATAQAFLASHLMIELDAHELRDAWRRPCTGAIPFDDLMNIPTFCYYLDLSPIEAEARGCGAFVSWEDRFGMVETTGVSLHVVKGHRLPKPVADESFVAMPMEIPLLAGKTVRDCVYRLLDDGLLNGADASSPKTQEAVAKALEPMIDEASRMVSLIGLVNRKLAYDHELPKYFDPLENRSGAIAIPNCIRLSV